MTERSAFSQWCGSIAWDFVQLSSGYGKQLHHTVEDSPYHREPSVLWHTKWAIEECAKEADARGLTERDTFLAVMAAAFHDIGKPDCEETVWSDTIGWYRRYRGHEKRSARLFVDWVNSNWDHLIRSGQDGLLPYANINDWIYTIPFMIEHHVPYGYGQAKKRALFKTLDFFGAREAFLTLCLGDMRGRASDWSKDSAEDWIADTYGLTDMINFPDFHNPDCYILVGPSGVGKDSLVGACYPGHILSLDTMRLDFFRDYNKVEEGISQAQEYRMAFDYASQYTEEFNRLVNKETTRVFKSGENVVVNDTNLTKKARRRAVTEARRRGYNIHAIVFNNASLGDLIQRQTDRGDKFVPTDVVRNQFFKLTMPMLEDEVDSLDVLTKGDTF